jgi:peptidoglycan/LPS O-acetylase OafA/YrhL
MIVDDFRLSPNSNNLTLVRLLLAAGVIWTHSYWRATAAPAADFDQFSAWLGQPISAFAVDGFFFLSGYLVYASLLRRGSVKEFVAARLARLWPGLAVALILTVAVGATLTTAQGLDYLRGPTARFLVYNLSLLYPAYDLTGVICGNRPCDINQSLWTIPWEVRCYAALAILAWCGLARPNAMKRVILPATALFAALMHVPGAAEFASRHLGSTLAYYLTIADRLWVMFALGIAAYLWRDNIRLNWWTTLALLVALLLATRSGVPIPHLAQAFTASLVLNLGFLTAARRVVSSTWPDYSYGVYIYGFPMMMICAAAVPNLSTGALAAITAVATLLPAAASWHFVEKPVLDHFRHRRKRKAARAATLNSPDTLVRAEDGDDAESLMVSKSNDPAVDPI